MLNKVTLLYLSKNTDSSSNCALRSHTYLGITLHLHMPQDDNTHTYNHTHTITHTHTLPQDHQHMHMPVIRSCIHTLASRSRVHTRTHSHMPWDHTSQEITLTHTCICLRITHIHTSVCFKKYVMKPE